MIMRAASPRCSILSRWRPKLEGDFLFLVSGSEQPARDQSICFLDRNKLLRRYEENKKSVLAACAPFFNVSTELCQRKLYATQLAASVNAKVPVLVAVHKDEDDYIIGAVDFSRFLKNAGFNRIILARYPKVSQEKILNAKARFPADLSSVLVEDIKEFITQQN